MLEIILVENYLIAMKKSTNKLGYYSRRITS
jgi:hypothetical protein